MLQYFSKPGMLRALYIMMPSSELWVTWVSQLSPGTFQELLSRASLKFQPIWDWCPHETWWQLMQPSWLHGWTMWLEVHYSGHPHVLNSQQNSLFTMYSSDTMLQSFLMNPCKLSHLTGVRSLAPRQLWHSSTRVYQLRGASNLPGYVRTGHGIPWYLPISMGKFLPILRHILTVSWVKRQFIWGVKSGMSMKYALKQ